MWIFFPPLHIINQTIQLPDIFSACEQQECAQSILYFSYSYSRWSHFWYPHEATLHVNNKRALKASSVSHIHIHIGHISGIWHIARFYVLTMLTCFQFTKPVSLICLWIRSIEFEAFKT